jgi:hypothetical protein
MKNKFAKKCCWCGVMVDAYEGKAWNYKGRWYVGCQPCIDEKFAEENKDEEKKV